MRFRRPLDALQVEPTTRCTRHCAVCPRTVLADGWRSADLGAAIWARLRPDLRLAGYLHLQGWGEPLLHPQLRDMVRDARAARCRVGLTTNGDLLEEHVLWIVDERMDRVAVSVAGAASRHAHLRDGSDLEAVWRGISELARRRRRGRPKLQISYLLTADNAEDLAEVVRAAAAAGADEVFVTHLDVTPTVELARSAAFNGEGLRPGLGAALDRAMEQARVAKIAFRPPARHPEELLACALDPTRIAFMTQSGRVAPCVNLGLPVDGAIIRRSGEEKYEVDQVFWGDLHEQPLHEILDGAPANRFRAPFVARKAAEQRFLDARKGWGPPALRRLDRADRRRQAELINNPFPPECRGCPKADGW